MTEDKTSRPVNIVNLSLKCIRVGVEEVFLQSSGPVQTTFGDTHTHKLHTQTHRALVCYTVEIPELDFPSPPVS